MKITSSVKEKLCEFDMHSKVDLLMMIALCVEFCLKIALYGIGLEILDSSTPTEYLYRTCFRYIGILNVALAWTSIFKYPTDAKMITCAKIWTYFSTFLDMVCELMLVMEVVLNTRISYTLVIARTVLVIAYVLAQHVNTCASSYTIYTRTHISNFIFSIMYIMNTNFMVLWSCLMIYKLERTLNCQNKSA